MTVQDALAIRVSFGKHKGKTLEQVAKDEVTYIAWLAGREDIKSQGLSEASRVLAAYFESDISLAQDMRGAR